MAQPLKKIIAQSKERITFLKKLISKWSQEEDLSPLDSGEVLEEKNKEKEVVVHLSWQSVSKSTVAVLVLLALAQFVTQISTVLLILFVSILFAAALDPMVDRLERKRVPRAISVLIMFLGLLFLLGFFISQLIPLVAEQLIEMARNLSALVQTLDAGNLPHWLPQSFRQWVELNVEQLDKQQVLNQALSYLETIETQLQAVAGNTIGLIKDIFNGIFNFFLVLILTFFLVVDERGVEGFFISLFPSRHGKYVFKKMEAIKDQVGQWLRGQMILMLLMFCLSLIAFLILGLDNALTLAMMAGIAELIPVAGPLFAGLPALMVAFNESAWLALWALGVIILLQQIEGNVLVPMVMKRTLGLSPIIIILTMLIGYNLLGVLGVVIAIPVTTTVAIFVKDYASKKK
jgi:predicted PurR-regulated permease PerM